VPQPAQHPPQAHGVVAGHVVVDHDLLARAHAALVHLGGELGEVGQRVAAVFPGLGSGQVVVDVHEVGTGDVPLCIYTRTRLRVGELVASVDDDPVRIAEVLR
jgi:hypothetical protein